MPDYQRILIMKPSSLGDIVHTLPTFSLVRQAYPKAEISWFVKRQWAGLLERVEGLTHILRVDQGIGAWGSQIGPLRAGRFDLVLDLQGLFRSGMMSLLSGCPLRMGFANAREGSPWFYTRRVHVPNPDMHAIDRYLLLAAELGIPTTGPLHYNLHPTSLDRERIHQLLDRHRLSSRLQRSPGWIAINPGGRWETKRWPIASFARLADHIQQEGIGQVGFLGGREDQDLVARIGAGMNTPFRDLTGMTGVEILPALMESCELLVTNDSGPMHVAAAMGTPTVSLFGATNPTRTGPYGSEHQVLRHSLPCSPCLSRTCRNPVPKECMELITEEEVFHAVRRKRARS